jgi:hypothetical protein
VDNVDADADREHSIFYRIDALNEGIRKESDRGTILILAAFLDELLGEIIRAFATNKNSDENLDEFLKYGGPAGEFSSRINICRTFGFIGIEEVQALHHVRKIRNYAAHFDRKGGRGFDVLFDSAKTINLVDALATAMKFKLVSKTPDCVRTSFVSLTRVLSLALAFRLWEASPYSAACPMFQLPDDAIDEGIPIEIFIEKLKREHKDRYNKGV